MEYFLVHFDGRMGFVHARDEDGAMFRAAREFGYETLEDCRNIEIEVDSLDNVSLEDVNHIRGFGGHIPQSVREHFGLAA